eukprot:scaffold716_cov364-Pinguiococcus_pyrenoidosus.AAC.6
MYTFHAEEGRVIEALLLPTLPPQRLCPAPLPQQGRRFFEEASVQAFWIATCKKDPQDVQGRPCRAGHRGRRHLRRLHVLRAAAGGRADL